MITDYDSLALAVKNWLARSDLDDAIPQFIQLGEARLFRDARIRKMHAYVFGTYGDGITSNPGEILLPVDFQGTMELRIVYGGSTRELGVLPFSALADSQVVGATNAPVTGCPIGYVVLGDVIKIIGGSGTGEYALFYWRRLPSVAFSPITPSDPAAQYYDLLIREPGAYLYSALAESAPYMKEDDRVQTWDSKYLSIIGAMNLQAERESLGNAPVMRGMSRAP